MYNFCLLHDNENLILGSVVSHSSDVPSILMLKKKFYYATVSNMIHDSRPLLFYLVTFANVNVPISNIKFPSKRFSL